jgi:L-lactate dehydrogenase complex protein LldF
VVEAQDREAGLRERLEPERLGLRAMAAVFASRRRYEAAQKLARAGQLPLARGGKISWLPGELGGWTAARDLPAVPGQSFREWWRAEGRP